MKTIIKYVRDMHVLQTKGIFRQLHREITGIWLLWYSFVWVMIGWHLPALNHPILVPPGRTPCLLGGGPRNVVVYDPGMVVLLLLLGRMLRWGPARRRPPWGLWIKSPLTFCPLMCSDGWGQLDGWGTGITGRVLWGPRTLIALWRVRGHARIGRANIRGVNPWSPGSLSGSSSGYVRCLHRRLGLRPGRAGEGIEKRTANRKG
jgi:hypothetical protein